MVAHGPVRAPIRPPRGRAGLPVVLAALAALVAAPAPAVDGPAAAPGLDQEKALALSREAVGRVVGDYTLLDRNGRPVRLADYRGKPLVVSFLYTGCFQVCPTTTRSLREAVSAAHEALGADKFRVASIGFNQPFDSPAAMKSYGAQHGLDLPNWELLSPPRPVVAELTRAFGFSYVATPAGFDHVLQVSLVDGEGRIVRQIYGERFGADMLVDPLKQLVTGAPLAPDAGLAGLIERVRILCTVYDPATGRYRVNYGIVFEIAGGVTFLAAMLVWFVRERRRPRSPRGA